MIVPRAAASRRRLALLALQLGLFVAALGGPAAVNALQIHSVVISPTTAVVGTSTTFTVTVTNLSVSPGQTLMSCVRIAIPASLTLSGTPTVSALDPPVPPGTSRTWSAPTVVTGALQTVRTGIIINDVNPDGQVVVTFTGTPTAAGDLTFTTEAFGQVNCSGQSSILSGSQPTVTVTATNDAPVCSDDAGSTAEDVPLSDAVTCADVDGDTLTYAAVTGPTNGDLVFNPDGTFTYTPDPDFTGVDSFTFNADDGDLTSTTATFTITVGAVNDAPGVQRRCGQHGRGRPAVRRGDLHRRRRRHADLCGRHRPDQRRPGVQPRRHVHLHPGSRLHRRGLVHLQRR